MLRGKTDGFRHAVHLCVLSCTAILLLQIVVACGAAPPSATVYGPRVATHAPVVSSPTATATATAVPTSNPSPLALHGPTNFLLSNAFSFALAKGTTTDSTGANSDIDAGTVQTGVTTEFKHVLFVVDSHNTIKVYSPGASAPVSTQVYQHDDGSVVIQYTQVVSSVTTTFNSTLSGSQITVIYQQTYAGQASTTDPVANAGSTIAATFTTQVQWVAPDQIPTAPENGKYQLTSDGGATIAWSAGQNAHGYDVYRLIANVDQQYQLITTVTTTSYSDESASAKQYDHVSPGIGYAVFSIGSTGVENPSDVTITVNG
jgi:hypothetical protein